MHQVVPARAGVIPSYMMSYLLKIGGTRASGGDPGTILSPQSSKRWYPRERG